MRQGFGPYCAPYISVLNSHIQGRRYMPRLSCKKCQVRFFWEGKPAAIVAVCPICSADLSSKSMPTRYRIIRLFAIGLPWANNAGKFDQYMAQNGDLSLALRCGYCSSPAPGPDDPKPHHAFPGLTCRCSDRENEGLGNDE